MIHRIFATLLFGLIVSGASAADKPNIVFILADDLGWGDIGCNGQKTLTTPNIDRMAAEGMRFTRHYAGSTVCAPSRCVLMTGLHTGHCRVRGNDNWIIPDGDVTVPNLLKKAGYRTAAIGKYGLGKPLPDDDPLRKGFDYFFGYVSTGHAHNFFTPFLLRNGKQVALEGNTVIPGSENGTWPGTGVAPLDGRKQWAPQLFSEDVQAYLKERGEKKDGPFFLYYALNIPHANNEVKKDSPLGHGLESPDYGEFKNRDWPDAEKGFAQFIRFLDNEVGGVIETLKKTGMAENTILMFSSDNGPHQEGGHLSDFFDSNGPLNGIKRDLTDGGVRVPLIAWCPGKIKAGVESKHVSGFQDFLPTIAEISGASLTTETDGISYAPTLFGNPDGQKQHPYLFWDFNEQGGKRAVLKWPWKLIHLNTLGVAGKGKGKPKPLQTLLFNLDNDEGEQTNVADQNPEVLAELEPLLKSGWTDPQ